MIRKLLILAAVTCLAAGDVGGAGTGAASEAVQLVDRTGRNVGSATLTEGPLGLHIVVEIDALPPGRRAFHIHETGRCDPPDFESAGGHFDPEGNRHGMENPHGPHAGDLPNLRIGPDGRVRMEVLNPRVTLGTGKNSLLSGDGTSLIIHESEDDYYTDPTGDAGGRIACGVIGR